MTTKRDQIINEIYNTEEFYVCSLQTCFDFFYQELISEESSTIIPYEDVTLIFERYEEILGVNKRFFLALRRLKENNQMTTSIGQTFKLYLPFFKCYFFYISHYDSVNKLLSKYENESKFNNLLDKIVQKIPTSTHLDLRSYLIMPVQRLPRYQLLLVDLFKNTPKDHEDYPSISAAVDLIKKVTTDVNEKTKISEQKEKVTIAQNYISGLDIKLVEPNRLLVLEGSLTKVCKKTNKSRYFYLFNDLLLYGPGVKKINVSEWFYLKHVYIEPDQRYQNAFIVKNNVKSFSVLCEDSSEMKTWYTAIQKYAEIQRNGLHVEDKDDIEMKEAWVPDNLAKNCMLCNLPFSLVTRRHHCRKCGKCVCANCSKGKITVSKKCGMERVCDRCLEKYEKSSEDSEVTKSDVDKTEVQKIDRHTKNRKSEKAEKKKRKSTDGNLDETIEKESVPQSLSIGAIALKNFELTQSEGRKKKSFGIFRKSRKDDFDLSSSPGFEEKSESTNDSETPKTARVESNSKELFETPRSEMNENVIEIEVKKEELNTVENTREGVTDMKKEEQQSVPLENSLNENDLKPIEVLKPSKGYKKIQPEIPHEFMEAKNEEVKQENVSMEQHNGNEPHVVSQKELDSNRVTHEASDMSVQRDKEKVEQEEVKAESQLDTTKQQESGIEVPTHPLQNEENTMQRTQDDTQNDVKECAPNTKENKDTLKNDQQEVKKEVELCVKEDTPVVTHKEFIIEERIIGEPILSVEFIGKTVNQVDDIPIEEKKQVVPIEVLEKVVESADNANEEGELLSFAERTIKFEKSTSGQQSQTAEKLKSVLPVDKIMQKIEKFETKASEKQDLTKKDESNTTQHEIKKVVIPRVSISTKKENVPFNQKDRLSLILECPEKNDEPIIVTKKETKVERNRRLFEEKIRQENERVNRDYLLRKTQTKKK
ncbi:Rho/RAC guanine nucleotide exchange factor, putative [Entamoeba invadens IP1]|uniref:Rho/RAC guanine nucleotide exchange factor, putative n=1 Tax=Entamoeba invadens IP1 TaxID=370355 RepID=A0A0A1TXL5_ENTIV|nr:Rho/RAC guanine nucleotide exchange factor, putative [Entamoeba invadens IP1]ELP86095.1 Rho/RAC guanine nucleotide exchange factor, putative [Entamoeba invadens IP1]|eukprot:XP_004185441.1 Rho/RAC guanine nucleotide exchange factor, putative [Entamoeba invadens IP1]